MNGGCTSTSLNPPRQFEFLEINCLQLYSPYDAYVKLWKGLSGERVSSNTARQRLSDYFTVSGRAKMGCSSNIVTICLLDEIDFLVSGNESVIYNFFDWPQMPESALVVVGIANTMDLPERLSTKVRSRLGGDHANRMVFQPYLFSEVSGWA